MSKKNTDYGINAQEIKNMVSKTSVLKVVGATFCICLMIVVVGVYIGVLVEANTGGYFPETYDCFYLNSTCDDDQVMVENYFKIVVGDDFKRGVYPMYSTDCGRLCCPDWFSKGNRYTCEIENLENTIDGEIQILEAAYGSSRSNFNVSFGIGGTLGMFLILIVLCALTVWICNLDD